MKTPSDIKWMVEWYDPKREDWFPAIYYPTRVQARHYIKLHTWTKQRIRKYLIVLKRL